MPVARVSASTAAARAVRAMAGPSTMRGRRAVGQEVEDLAERRFGERAPSRPPSPAGRPRTHGAVGDRRLEEIAGQAQVHRARAAGGGDRQRARHVLAHARRRSSTRQAALVTGRAAPT